MKRVVIGLFVVAALAGGYVLLTNSDKNPENPVAAVDPEAKDGDAKDTKERKSLLPDKFPGQEDTRPPEERDPVTDETELNPTVGLQMVSATETDRLDAKVPDNKWGKGVVVTGVLPDSPADEIRLKSGDLIVRAHREHVNSPQDLIDASTGRDHILITFVRNGKYLQAVLKKPYRPEDN